MTTIEPGAPSPSDLPARIKGILLDPKAEWPKIEAEPATIGSLYSRYIVILAAVPAVATFLRDVLFGVSVLGITYKPGFLEALWSAVLQYGLALVGVMVVALVIEALAPLFDGRKDRVSALKLAAYSATAGWLANAFVLIPGLGFLTILGIYTLYLVYTGAPVLMKVPQSKALGFTATLVVAAIIVSVVLFWLWSAIGSTGTPQVQEGAAPQSGTLSGQLNVPGVGGVDVGKLENLSKRIESMASGEGQLRPIESGALDALLPASLPGGYERTASATSDSTAAAMGIAAASAVYGKDAKTITLSVTDMGVAGAVAAITGAIGLNTSEQTDGTYRHLASVDGRMTMEEFNTTAMTGIYSTLVGERIMVKAEGSGATLDELKSAVRTIDLAQLEALAAN